MLCTVEDLSWNSRCIQHTKAVWNIPTASRHIRTPKPWKNWSLSMARNFVCCLYTLNSEALQLFCGTPSNWRIGWKRSKLCDGLQWIHSYEHRWYHQLALRQKLSSRAQLLDLESCIGPIERVLPRPTTTSPKWNGYSETWKKQRYSYMDILQTKVNFLKPNFFY